MNALRITILCGGFALMSADELTGNALGIFLIAIIAFTSEEFRESIK